VVPAEPRGVLTALVDGIPGTLEERRAAFRHPANRLRRALLRFAQHAELAKRTAAEQSVVEQTLVLLAETTVPEEFLAATVSAVRVQKWRPTDVWSHPDNDRIHRAIEASLVAVLRAQGLSPETVLDEDAVIEALGLPGALDDDERQALHDTRFASGFFRWAGVPLRDDVLVRQDVGRILEATVRRMGLPAEEERRLCRRLRRYRWLGTSALLACRGSALHLARLHLALSALLDAKGMDPEELPVTRSLAEWAAFFDRLLP
jgi:hypothetical protein